LFFVAAFREIYAQQTTSGASGHHDLVKKKVETLLRRLKFGWNEDVDLFCSPSWNDKQKDGKTTAGPRRLFPLLWINPRIHHASRNRSLLHQNQLLKVSQFCVSPQAAALRLTTVGNIFLVFKFF
jgi:hypothetical protein